MSENKPDLMAELAEVVRLSDAATPGEWRTEYRKSPRGYGQEVFDSFGATIAELAWHAVPKNETTTMTDREPNAQLIAAAVNFLRTHHAELEAVVRDAQAWRSIDADAIARNAASAVAPGLISVCSSEKMLRDFVIQAIKDALKQHAMHNSAREG